jgi:hypothetical protein
MDIVRRDDEDCVETGYHHHEVVLSIILSVCQGIKRTKGHARVRTDNAEVGKKATDRDFGQLLSCLLDLLHLTTRTLCHSRYCDLSLTAHICSDRTGLILHCRIWHVYLPCRHSRRIARKPSI